MSVIAPYTSTFGSLGFKITGNQGALPAPGNTTIYQKDKIPYGDLSTIQISGSTIDDLQVQAIVDEADFAALASAEGTTATLTILGDSARTALLAKVGSKAAYSQGHVITTLLFVFW